MILTVRDADPRHRLGRDGEAAAERLLGRAGMRLLARRFRCRAGEIDLVVRDGAVIVFVEVKTRSGTAWGDPAAAVDARKRARIARAAQVFLAGYGLEGELCRFDVVEVRREPSGRLAAEHLRDAFRIGLWS